MRTLLGNKLTLGLLALGIALLVAAPADARDRHPRYADRVDQLIGQLRYGDEGGREHAAKDLGNYSDRRAVFALMQAAMGDPGDDVRKESIRSLRRIGDPIATDALGQALLDVRNDRNEDVRKEAARALGEIGDGRAFRWLREGLSDPDSGVRKEVRKALDQLRRRLSYDRDRDRHHDRD
jgi:HEAT repeat protein